MIETKDLILKQGSADDWQDLYRNLWSNGEVFRYMFSKPSPTEEHAMKKTAAYAEMHKEVKTEFFVYDKTTEQAIGIAGLKEMQPSVYTVTDIAICPDFHGKSYGKQILNALLSLAFGELCATEVHYDCFEQNKVSKRLALSCGFAYTHSEEAELMKDGEKVILDYYSKRKPSFVVELKPRTRENVILYFERVQDEAIKRFLPQKAKSVEEAITDFEKTLLPNSTSYGKSIYVDSNYIGDIWAYCIGDDDPNAMLSFCVFDKSMWGKGIATEAARIFVSDIKVKFDLQTLGAFTFSNNYASIKVLLNNGFQEKETFTENGIESKYLQIAF